MHVSKIRFDGEYEKFCKIFCKLNRAAGRLWMQLWPLDQDGSKGAALDVCATHCKLETLAGMWRESYRTVQGMLGVSAPRLLFVDCRCFSLLFLLYYNSILLVERYLNQIVFSRLLCAWRSIAMIRKINYWDIYYWWGLGGSTPYLLLWD
jgi:hypothetical protein